MEREGRVFPVFMESYGAHLESHHVEITGDLVIVTTREEPRSFYTCGSCQEPEGVWTLRLTPEGVLDLGHRYTVPEVGWLDDLLVSAQCEKDVSLADPDVLQILRETIAASREDGDDESRSGW